MALSKVRLGDYLKLYRECCGIADLTCWDVSGVNKNKEFFEPAKQVGEDTSNYKIVPPDYFACNLMHIGRDVVLPIALNRTSKNKYVSPAYTVFCLVNEDLILKDYLFMYLNSSEKDRFFWFHCDGSVRDGMDWNVFCDMEIEVPPIEIQQKYVDIYQGMVNNQKAYERGLEDLKLVCDGYFDVAKKQYTVSLGELIEKVDVRNSSNLYSAKDVRGITNKKEFSETKADISTVDLSKFKVVKPRQFAYNSRTDGREMLVLALNREDYPIIVTFNYNVFSIRQEKIDMIDLDYLYAFFKRSEFDRRVRFNSWGSSQELLSWDNLCNIQVPVPTIKKQEAVAEIINLYFKRKAINERLKAQIKDICPILIKGSIDEAR